jgi:cell division protein FtsA
LKICLKLKGGFIILTLLKDVFTEQEESNHRYRLVLDIGTEYVKALIVRFNNRRICEVVGYGKVKQDEINMKGGAISNIEEVVKKCHQAIDQALEMTEVHPEEIVMGIAGEFVKGIVTEMKEKRLFSSRKLKQKEIKKLVYKAQEEALASARDKLRADIGLDDVEVKLINSSVVDMKIDGYRITNPEEFQGKNLELTVFSTFAPMVHVGALENIAQRLGYKLVGIIAEPFAVAKSIMREGAHEFGAIVIDIGGGTTDIALIRQGGIEGTKMFSWAGRAFTRSLARQFDLSLAQAEKLKLKYSKGELDRGNDKIKQVLKRDFKLLYEGIELALDKLAREEALPGRIYLCGGGSALKGLDEGISQDKLYEDLPFYKKPKLKVLTAEKISNINDRTGKLSGTENVTPKSLGLQATRIQRVKNKSIWEKIAPGL